MAKHDSGSNPFGWLILGFICGAVATLGALIAFSGGLDETGPPAASAPEEVAGPAADPTAAGPSAAPAAEAPPPAAAPTVAPPRAAPPAVDDPQIAEDAAASGMTARSPRR